MMVDAEMLRIFQRLCREFGDWEVKTRTQGNRTYSYVTARTIMNRLDEVVGPHNWWDQYQPLERSVLCTLTIRLPGGATISKQDAGGYAGLADPGDDDKSGFSDAFKRTAVKFGIGRYLYGDGAPSWMNACRRSGPKQGPEGAFDRAEEDDAALEVGAVR